MKNKILLIIISFTTVIVNAQNDFDEIRKVLKSSQKHELSELKDQYPNLSIYEYTLIAEEANTKRRKAAVRLKKNKLTKLIKNNSGLEGFIKVKKIARNDLLRASYIYLDDKTKMGKQLADSLLTLHKKGAVFSDLAQTYSKEVASRDIGGDLGWFKEKDMVEELSQSVKKHKKGDSFKVYTKDFGWLVVMVTEKAQKRMEYHLLEVEEQGTIYEIKNNYKILNE